MKVAVLSSHTPSLFWFRMDMMQAFKKLGHEVIAIGNEEEEKWKDKFSEQGIRYLQVNINRNGTNPIMDLKIYRDLRKVLLAEKPDKIFTYQAKTVIYGTLAANHVGIYEVYPLIAGVGSIFLSKGLKTRILKLILTMEYKLALKRCPHIFFQNRDDVDLFERHRIIEKSKVVILNGSGVNIEKFKVQELPEIPSFLCVSRLIRDKGVYEYLLACEEIKKKYSNVRCLLVGPYDTNPSAITKNELEPFIKDGTVEYFGEQVDVRPYLAQCSVFVLPSYREGTPKTVLEAMACGRAVITTDAPGCKETVIDKENGYLVPVKNVSAIVEKMELLINDFSLVEKMARTGRALAEDKFDVNKINAVIIDIMKLK